MQRIQGARCWRYRCPTPSGTTLCRPRWSQAATSGAVHFVLFVHLRPCVPCQRIALPQTDLCVLPVTGSVRIAAVDGLNSLGSSGRRFLLYSCTTHGTSVVRGCIHTAVRVHMYLPAQGHSQHPMLVRSSMPPIPKHLALISCVSLSPVSLNKNAANMPSAVCL